MAKIAVAPAQDPTEASMTEFVFLFSLHPSY